MPKGRGFVPEPESSGPLAGLQLPYEDVGVTTSEGGTEVD
jgi:hypothetical protein